MSSTQHTDFTVITGAGGAPYPMPESLLLRRLSFIFVSAVETCTNFLLACEAHIPPSPSPRPIRISRKRSLPMPPGSPTSITGNAASPISILDVEDHLSRPLFDDKSTSRRSRSSRSHNPSSNPNTASRRRPKSSSKTDKLHRHPSRLPRRNTHPGHPHQHSHPRQHQDNRPRTTARRTQDTRPSLRPSLRHLPNERLAFVQPTANKVSNMNVCRRNRDTQWSQKRIRSEPPVAPISLPPTIRQVPRGTLTSFVTSDDSTLLSEQEKPLESVTAKDTLLDRGIRPSRRVRFAQTVQLVC